MTRYFYLSILSVLSLAGSLRAQDGGQLYELYCSACHGVDGKGAGDGTFPPLAGSEWLQGDSKRAVLIVLKGLEGPIEVSGKAYNLAMPPHEASLDENQIRAILDYVNRSWGNANQKTERDTIRVLKSEYANREKPWTAKELLKLFPLPKQETPLENVISRVYKGQWNRLPDFNKIESENVEEEHNGIIDLSIAGLADRYGIVWEADFIAPTDGEYEFRGLADDGLRIILNDTTVGELNSLGPVSDDRAAQGSVTLKKGKNDFRLEYFDGGGNTGLDLRWRKSGTKKWQFLSPAKAASTRQPPIMLAPADGKTVIYRNFIGGTSPRAIGFGFPGQVNLAYSGDDLAPELLWSGNFLDASRHWNGRGKGEQKPASKNIMNLTAGRYLPGEAKFKGFTLDKKGNPTFLVKLGEQTLHDTWKPGKAGTLDRTLTLEGGTEPLTIPHAIPDRKEPTVSLSPGTPVTLTYRLK